MFDHRFFASKLGLASLVSITAMVAFNFFAIAQIGMPMDGIAHTATAMVLA